MAEPKVDVKVTVEQPNLPPTKLYRLRDGKRPFRDVTGKLVNPGEYAALTEMQAHAFRDMFHSTPGDPVVGVEAQRAVDAAGDPPRPPTSTTGDGKPPAAQPPTSKKA